MSRHLYCVFTFIFVATSVLLVSNPQMSGAQEESQDRNKYVLRVEGTEGVRLEMLLITKSTARTGPKRESATITVPFSKEFSAASFYAWFDTLPGGASGKPGDTYHIFMEKNGRPDAEVEGIIKPDVHAMGGLGDL